MKTTRDALILIIMLGNSSVMAANAETLQDAGLLAVWKDGEIRQTYDPQKKVTDAFVAWVPSCQQANPTITFHATFKGRDAALPPSHILVRADLGARYSPNLVRKMTFSFVLDQDSTVDLAKTLQPPAGPTEPGANVENGTAVLDLRDFNRLLAAKKLTVNVFGQSCAVSQSEIDALRSFANAVLPRH